MYGSGSALWFITIKLSIFCLVSFNPDTSEKPLRLMYEKKAKPFIDSAPCNLVRLIVC